MKTNRIQFDSTTKKWFEAHRDAVTTIRRCDKCGLYYKSSLGHKCKEDDKDETR